LSFPDGDAVAFEAAFGWGWLDELLEDYGFEPHLVHPSRCKAIASARLKNDRVDAQILAQLLRADLLPEAFLFRGFQAPNHYNFRTDSWLSTIALPLRLTRAMFTRLRRAPAPSGSQESAPNSTTV